MFERMSTAYMQRQSVKVAAFGGLLGAGTLLFWFAGGFPPWAWRFLFQVLPQIPQLWAERGPGMISPFAGLILLSLALLILWVTLTALAIQVGLHWWRTAAQQESEQQFGEREAELWELEEPWPNEPVVQQSRPSVPLQQQQMAVGAEMRPAPLMGSMQGLSTAPWTTVKTRSTGSLPPRQLRIVRPLQPWTNDDTPFDLSLDEDEPVDTDAPGDISSDELSSDFATLPEIDLDDIDLAEEEEELVKPTKTEVFATSSSALTSPGEPYTRLLVGVGLDAGIVRRNSPNEDTLLAVQSTRVTDRGAEPIGLFVVADGMGGHAHGQEASRLAIKTMGDVVVPILTQGVVEIDSFNELLRDGIHRANMVLCKRNHDEGEMMGTTMTTALIVGTTAYIANVGDSRTYLYRRSEGLRSVTRDHSIVAQMVESGMIEPDEIYTHPKRNQIYRCLGDRATVDVDTFEEPLRAGDVLLLCSDGLWEMVRDDDIARIIETSLPHPTQISSALIQAALTRGGADNISVVVVYACAA